ncbi:2-C-methyl-D-erythritol 4-phosphate cytidylyltransferase [Sediminibacterium ginsengisoli]|uniref:2-C-methyl-D-erythritol 4-phosphate cytidylyltransferase n=1 Tax=Sediminibacterium ginsengisoli TaxID=413434 RepID=A0A1T4RN79_9BACT|nr:2-C-methyl-D-erythritol 4-phosphate cytidylyltransferase [Sediminibacterium ginsengisoli]SKA17131.1 2-C-methyl-D-erythritol 4-phosphate cytidylyltransferase [Sediminibacterium ginsengisoli]
MRKYAVIVAGGSGQRMGSNVAKQFLLLQGKPVLWHTLNRFLNAYEDLSVILVLPQQELQRGAEIIAMLGAEHRCEITAGGATRFHSVKNGLQLVKEPSVVLVHDGVRCLVGTELIRRCCETAMARGNAIPAVAATDSIRIEQDGHNSVADRKHVRIVQTPQTFLSDILLPAFETEYSDAFTDEATVAEAAGHIIHLVEGDYANIKITRPVDLLLAEKILEDQA